MPMTHDGVIIDPDGTEAPSLESLALSLSRQPRFTGMTQRWFSVLDHSLFILQLAQTERNLRAHEALALLLHDAHEGLTGDVPSDLKPAALKAIQKLLDILIVRAHYGDQQELWRGMSPLIKEYDQRCLVAEAMVIGPAAFATIPRSLFLQKMGSLPRDGDMELLRARLKMGMLSNPQMLQQNEHAPNVKRFVLLVRTLQGQAETVLHPMTPPTPMRAYGVAEWPDEVDLLRERFE